MLKLKEYLVIKRCVRKHVRYLELQAKWDAWNDWKDGLKSYLRFEDKVRKAEKEFIATLDKLQELNVLDEDNCYTNKKYENYIVKLQKRHAILRAEFERLENAKYA